MRGKTHSLGNVKNAAWQWPRALGLACSKPDLWAYEAPLIICGLVPSRARVNSLPVAVSPVCKSGQSGEILFEATADYESYRLDLNEPSVQIASQAIENIGASREYVIADGGLDSNSLYLKGIPAVTLGVGQMNPHTVAESLNLDDYDSACRIAFLIATGR